MPSQLQGDGVGVGALPLNWVECEKNTMSDEVITSLEQVTPEWLTGVLANSGVLTRGSVTTCDVETGGGNWSKHAKLALRYAEGSQGALPQRLFLKMVKTDWGDGAFGPSEVTYYTRDYVDVKEALLVVVYG